MRPPGRTWRRTSCGSVSSRWSRSTRTRTRSGGKKTGNSPVDRSKKGTKRSVLAEAAGVPVAVAADGANRRDMKMVRETLENIVADRPEPTRRKPQGLCLDKDYDYAEVYELLAEFKFTAHTRRRGVDYQQVKRSARKKARRWVVERTHSWMNRFRGILIRWAKKPDNYLAQLHFVCAFITLRCAGIF